MRQAHEHRRPDPESLTDLFWATARRMRHGSKDTLAPFGLSPSQSRALRVLARYGDQRLGDIASRLEIAPRSATEVIDGLEAHGLVARCADPSDRRATLASITDQGWDLLTQLRQARQREANDLFATLTEAERTELTRILRRLDGRASDGGQPQKDPADEPA